MSISVNRILANHANLARNAAIVASTQRPSTDVRLVAQQRAGGGRVSVGGAYTGAADTLIDIEVVSGSGGDLTASAPRIAGVGNGTLTVTAISPVAEPETLTVALLDAGAQPEPAVLEFFGASLAARAPGASSNALALAVTRNLTTSPMQYATLAPIAAGADAFEGPQFDWGQPPATDAGIPAAALRIQFAGFPTVHRAWKTWESGRFIYRIDPAATYDIPEDTRVFGVAGDYTLTLTDGVVSETYTAVTLYDFLSQVEARSALATVRGAVAADRAPGGMAVTDIPLRTDAHALPAAGGRVEVVSVDPAAATENITLTHLGTAGGGRAWSVAGGVSGALPNARTGALYTHGPVSFRVPDADPAAAGDGRMSAVVQLTSREEGEGIPSICFKPLVLGAMASDKTVTFTYRQRPPADCVCNEMLPLAVSMRCLGLEDTIMSNYDPAYFDRVKAVYAWRETFVRGNTSAPTAGLPGTTTCVTTGYQVELTVVGLAGVVAGKFSPGGPSFALFKTRALAEASAETFVVGGKVWGDFNPLGGLVSAHNAANEEISIYAYGMPGYAELEPHEDEIDTVLTVSAINVVAVEDCTTTGAVSRSNKFLAAARDLDWAESAIAILLSPLAEIYNEAEALAEWDALWAEVQSDLAALAGGGPDQLGFGSQDRYMDRYRAAVDNVYLAAGLLPKTSAGSDAGECWRDYPDATHWWVDESGEYLPAFTNEPYVSAARDADGKPISTQEFGLGVVTPCAHRLKVGDLFRVTIRGTGTVTAREGTKIVIPVIAAASAPFVGGKDGDPTQRWTVRGTVSGALPDWLYSPAAHAPYVDGPATLELAPGGIPWEVGDRVSVSLEGGALRWRRDGGAWTTGNLYGVTHAIGNGLTLAAQPGAAPSFVAGDTWQYRAVATHGISRLRQPRIGEAFAWDGAGVVLDVDFGAVQPLEAVLLALHTLPSGCVVTVTGGDAAPGEWAAAPAWHPSAVLAVLAAGTTARYLRVTVTGAGAGAALGWLWAGKGWQPSVGASDLTLRRQYGLSRGQGLNAAALYRGRGMGGAWRWSLDQGGALVGTNADDLLALIDHTAEQGMEPVCVVPDMRDPARAAVAIIDADEVVMTEHNMWQSSTLQAPLISVELPFRAVLS